MVATMGGEPVLGDGLPYDLQCLDLRKVDPLRRGLRGYDAWISGLRRSHGESRAESRSVETERTLEV